MYEAGNHLLVCAGYSDPELHSHSAAHILISLDEKIEIITENKLRFFGIFHKKYFIIVKMLYCSQFNDKIFSTHLF